MQRLPIFVVATLLRTYFSTPVADTVPSERLISETSEGPSAGIARWRQAREASMQGRDEASRNAAAAAEESIDDREHDSSQTASNLSALARWRRARDTEKGSAATRDSASGHAGAAGSTNWHSAVKQRQLSPTRQSANVARLRCPGISTSCSFSNLFCPQSPLHMTALRPKPARQTCSTTTLR